MLEFCERRYITLEFVSWLLRFVVTYTGFLVEKAG